MTSRTTSHGTTERAQLWAMGWGLPRASKSPLQEGSKRVVLAQFLRFLELFEIKNFSPRLS